VCGSIVLAMPPNAWKKSSTRYLPPCSPTWFAAGQNRAAVIRGLDRNVSAPVLRPDRQPGEWLWYNTGSGESLSFHSIPGDVFVFCPFASVVPAQLTMTDVYCPDLTHLSQPPIANFGSTWNETGAAPLLFYRERHSSCARVPVASFSPGAWERGETKRVTVIIAGHEFGDLRRRLLLTVIDE
jgi:hypothetical protein